MAKRKRARGKLGKVGKRGSTGSPRTESLKPSVSTARPEHRRRAKTGPPHRAVKAWGKTPRHRRSARRTHQTLKTLAVDIGGTGVKVMVLNEQGQPVRPRMRVETPQPATPDAVIDAVAGLARKQGVFDRVSVGFPGVVRGGITETAPNLDPEWTGHNLEASLTEKLGKPVRVANDADVQGFGAVEGRGVELVITLGTGVGSALFVDGRLVPNLELAHHPFRKGRSYEEVLGKAALKKAGKKKWNARLKRAIRELDKLFNYDALYIGGGHSKKIEIELPQNVKTVPNVAGLLGGIALWKHRERKE